MDYLNNLDELLELLFDEFKNAIRAPLRLLVVTLWIPIYSFLHLIVGADRAFEIEDSINCARPIAWLEFDNY